MENFTSKKLKVFRKKTTKKNKKKKKTKQKKKKNWCFSYFCWKHRWWVLVRTAYCLFDISWKDVFWFVFCFRWKSFVLTKHVLSETICLFCFCVCFSNIYTKIKFTAKSWSDLCNFNNKVIFWNFCLRKYFFNFLAKFELLMFHNNNVKISEKLNKWNLLKICLQITYTTDFCMIWLHFYYEKKKKKKKKWMYLIIQNNNDYNKTFCT